MGMTVPLAYPWLKVFDLLVCFDVFGFISQNLALPLSSLGTVRFLRSGGRQRLALPCIAIGIVYVSPVEL